MEVYPIRLLQQSIDLGAELIMDSSRAENAIRYAKESITRRITEEFHNYSDSNRLYDIMLGAVIFERQELGSLRFNIRGRATIYQEV